MTGKEQGVLGVVLSGGKGTRMGGVNKGLMSFNNQPLFQYAVDNLCHITNRILINSNTEKSAYQELGFQVIDDGKYPYAGPLAGVFAGLQAANESEDWVAFAPCDQLKLPEIVYRTLLKIAREQVKPKAVFARDEKDLHPLCCIVPCALQDSLKRALDTGELKVQQWMRANGMAIEFTDVDFANINEIKRS